MAESRLFYLVRHGVAEERGPDYPDDAQRPLTGEGKVRMQEIGRGLLALGVEVDEILTSPFVRTRQTAEILSGCWKPAPRVVDLEALAVGARTSGVLAALATQRKAQRVALVGHMPGLGLLGAELIGATGALEFKKGGVACIQVDGMPAPRTGTLLWLATPRMLRLVARG